MTSHNFRRTRVREHQRRLREGGATHVKEHERTVVADPRDAVARPAKSFHDKVDDAVRDGERILRQSDLDMDHNEADPTTTAYDGEPIENVSDAFIAAQILQKYDENPDRVGFDEEVAAMADIIGQRRAHWKAVYGFDCYAPPGARHLAINDKYVAPQDAWFYVKGRAAGRDITAPDFEADFKAWRDDTKRTRVWDFSLDFSTTQFRKVSKAYMESGERPSGDVMPGEMELRDSYMELPDGSWENMTGRQAEAARSSGPLQRFYVVRDPSPDSVMADVMWETDVNTFRDYGAGGHRADFRHENHTVYSDRAAAEKDAKERMTRRDTLRGGN